MSRHGPPSAYESETFGQNVSFHLEQPIGSMSISPSGRDVVLASKEGLHVIDLDSPYSPPRYLPHRTPWEVADVQWSPHASKDYWVASTSNQKAVVWNLAMKGWQGSIEYVLHAHSRAITDINWSAHNPWVLATCAVDSFVHSWDLRSPQKPAISFSDWFAGATQVKWSRQDEHIIASSHDKFLHIWDDRHGAAPVKTIEAHASKIYGIDWNRFESSKLVTCSMDRTIKFWNLTKEGLDPEHVIETDFPVWRARYTPIGWGLLAMPQRGNSDLHLYDRRPVDDGLPADKTRPVTIFSGHEGQVKEFLWRAGGTIVDGIDNRDFQLVSWGTDRELRLHRVERETLKGIGYVKGVNTAQRLNFTRKGAVYRTFRDEPDEFEQNLDALSRSDTVSTHHQSVASRQRANTGAGMSKLPVFQFRGWVSNARTHPRRGMHGKTAQRQNVTPIAWLKNVRIASWDQDTLADEIRHVGEKFKRVDFELVDIAHRKTVVCLQAPWGEKQSTVYLRVELRFPKLYPQDASAVVMLQKNSAISDEVHNTMVTELQTISDTYSSRKRGSIEGLLRYLLMEQTLEQLVAWVLGESLTDSRVLNTADVSAEESSDDEDDRLETAGSRLDASANARMPLPKGCGAIWSETGMLVCFFEPRSTEVKSTMSTIETGLVSESQASRLYEGFGRLRTSSPSRRATNEASSEQEDSDSDFSSTGQSSSSGSDASTNASAQLQDSVLPFKGALAGLHLKAKSTDRSNRSTIMGKSRQDGTIRSNYVLIHDFSDLLPSKRKLAEKYLIFGDGQQICQHNSRVAKELGQDDLSAVWLLAAMILRNDLPLTLVRQHRMKDDESVMILARKASQAHNKRSSSWKDVGGIKVKETKATGKVRWGNSPLGARYLLPALFYHFEAMADIQTLAMLSCIFSAFPNYDTPTASFADMEGPQQSSVGQSMHYFPSSRVAKSLRRESTLFDGYMFTQPFSEYGAVASESKRNARHNSYHRATRNSSSSHLNEKYAHDGMRRLSRAASISVEDASEGVSPQYYSLSTSPENARPRDRQSSGIGLPSAKASLSALTGSYSNSPPAHISGGASTLYLKKNSPSSSLTAGQWVANNLFGATSLNRINKHSLHHNDARISQSQGSNLRSRTSLTSLRDYQKEKDGGTTPDQSQRTTRNNSIVDLAGKGLSEKPGRRRVRIRVSLHNQENFDLEGYSPKPLLDPKLQVNFGTYRTGYAHLLDVWNLPVQKAEMQKYDVWLLELTDTEPNAPPGSRRPSHSVAKMTQQRPRRMTMVGMEQSEPVLQIRRCCQRCGEPLGAIEKNGVPIAWHCANMTCTTQSQKNTKRNSCVLCHNVLRGLAMPCLQCGHVTCYECCEAWFGPKRLGLHLSSKVVRGPRISTNKQGNTDENDVSDDGTQSCPSGCGCSCQSLTTISVPYPPNKREEEEVVSKQQSHRVSRSNQSVPILSVPEPPQAPTSAVAALNRVRSKSLAKDAAMSTRVRTSIKRSGSSFGGTLGLPSTSATAPTISEATIESDDERESPPKQFTHRPRRSQPPYPTSPVPPMNRSESNSGSDSSIHIINRGMEWSYDNNNNDDPLDPWAGSKYASLGRGVGGGLSRGLSSKASDATIRKVGTNNTSSTATTSTSTLTAKGRKSG